MAKVILSLGSNMGNRLKFLSDAKNQIKKNIGELLKCSSVYETPSWGYDDEKYLNIAIEINTQLSPADLLSESQKIEKFLGRKTKTNKTGKPIYFSRTIDIDILYYNNNIISQKDLIIPHPNLQKRNFVLFPLSEIAPNFVHPILRKSSTQLKNELSEKDKNEISYFSYLKDEIYFEMDHDLLSKPLIKNKGKQ